MYRRGNVLFLILLAVALFAALSYAVTQSNRSGGNNISDEDARLVASQILQAATQIRSGVERVRLINGCRHNQINALWPANHATSYNNGLAPADKSCHLFDPNGAGLTVQLVDEQWLDPDAPDLSKGWWVFNNLNAQDTHEVVNVGTNGGVETVLQVNWLKLEICNALNELIGNQLSAPPPLESGKICGDDAAAYIGLTEFCRYQDVSGDANYQFNAVLIAR